jgi:hypothetical protein
MDDLVNDPEIGGVLQEYMPQNRVRTYIKDSILNPYTKQKSTQMLQAHHPETIISKLYGVEITYHNAHGDVTLCGCPPELVFVIGRGTVLKWETALRRALEFIARNPKLRTPNGYPSICLQLAVVKEDVTDADKRQIEIALTAVDVRVYFSAGC